jgi:hypothetical protein
MPSAGDHDCTFHPFRTASDVGASEPQWRTIMNRRRSTRLPALTVVFITATLFGESQAAAEQSAYTSPWCAVYNINGGTPQCGFVTREQCLLTISGIGGTCVENVSNHGAAVPPLHRASVTTPRKRTRAHSS